MADGMTHCAKCGAELLGAKKFCTTCGAPAVDLKRELSSPTGASSAYGPPAVDPFASTASPGTKPGGAGPPSASYGPPPAPAEPQQPAAPAASEASPASALGKQISPLAASNLSQRNPLVGSNLVNAAAMAATAPSPSPGPAAAQAASAQPAPPSDPGKQPVRGIPGTVMMPSAPIPPIARPNTGEPSAPPGAAASQKPQPGTQVMQAFPGASNKPPSAGQVPAAAPLTTPAPNASPFVPQPPAQPHPPPHAMQPQPPPHAQPPMQHAGTPSHPWSAAPAPPPAWGGGWGAAPPAPPFGGYVPGARVQVTWSNGHRYPATIQQVAGGQVLVVFPDGQQHWVALQYVSPG